MKIQFAEKKPVDFPSKWCEFDGAKFLIAGTSKPAFVRKMEIFATKVSQEMNGNRMVTDETAEAMQPDYSKAYADLILDWEGVVDAEGKPVKYSADMAEQLCTIAVDPETKDDLSTKFTAFLIEQSHAIQLEADKSKEELLGKSLSATDLNRMAISQTTKSANVRRSASKRKHRK